MKNYQMIYTKLSLLRILSLTHGQNQREAGLRVGGGNGWGKGSCGEKMETTVFEQKFKMWKK